MTAHPRSLCSIRVLSALLEHRLWNLASTTGD
jgi:hypothetical protein